MQKFRLLRDNKESGPWSAEDLIKEGLKKYDLIWVEGRSAAWRYPCEIEVFKPYVPVVEEQPFDRFYRKPQSSVTSTELSQSPTIKQIPETRPAKPRIKVKAVCHKLEEPARKETAVNAAAAMPAINKPVTKTVSEKSADWESMWMDWEEEKKAVKTAASKKPKPQPAKEDRNEPQLEIKYTQSLDDIKEQYTKTVLAKKSRPSILESKQYFSIGIIVFAILGVGIWLGITWHSGPAGQMENSNAVLATPAPQPQQNDEDKQTQAEPANEAPGNGSADALNAVEQNEPIIKKNQPAKTIIKQASQQLPAKKNVGTIAKNNTPASDSYTKPLTGTDARKTKRSGDADNPFSNNSDDIKTESVSEQPVTIPQKKKVAAIGDYISVEPFIPAPNSANGVKFSVTNTSDIDFDMVMIDLSYTNAAGRFVKGETLYINKLNSGATVSVKAPDNSNASKITYKVSMISSEKNDVYLIAD